MVVFGLQFVGFGDFGFLGRPESCFERHFIDRIW